MPHLPQEVVHRTRTIHTLHAGAQGNGGQGPQLAAQSLKY